MNFMKLQTLLHKSLGNFFIRKLPLADSANLKLFSKKNMCAAAKLHNCSTDTLCRIHFLC